MIAYFDTSALVPLLIAEPGTSTAVRLWESADRRLTSRLAQVELRSALAQGRRLGRLSTSSHRSATRALDSLLSDIAMIELDESLASSAEPLAEKHALRAYDAVHLASALRVADAQTVFVAGDNRLLEAASSCALLTAVTA